MRTFEGGKLLFGGLLLFIAGSCASPEMVSPTDASTARSRISAAEAVKLAQPHLESLFRQRCEKRIDKRWCDKPARDYVVINGEFYHVARESYPYKTINAYLEPAVRVHRESGKLVLPEALPQ